LKIENKHYGDSHYQVAFTLANIGAIHMLRGKMEEAMANLRKALNI
jgi:hypothetical protein